MSDQTVKCFDQRELEEQRTAYKRAAKKEGSFMRCKGNTVLLMDGSKVTFEIDDEHLPSKAFLESAVKEMLE